MAISAFVIHEVEAAGNDTTNGGCFDPSVVNAGGFTDLVIASGNTSSPTASSASYNFVNGDIGAWVYAILYGWFKIVSQSGGIATLDGAIGHGVTYVGGASNARAGIPTTVLGIGTASASGITWSIDYSQQAAAQVNYTDLASVGAGLAVSSAASPFGKQQVGNCLNVTSGTNFTAERVIIASVAAAVATCTGPGNLTTGAGLNGVGSLGGAWATLGGAASTAVAGNDAFLNGAQTITHTTTNTPSSDGTNLTGYCVSWPTHSAAANSCRIIGYQSVRGDNGVKPVLKLTVASATVLTLAGNTRLDNLEIDCNSQTSTSGIVTGSTGILHRLRVRNCKGTAISPGANTAVEFCEVLAQSAGTGITGGRIADCEITITNSGAVGISAGGGSSIDNCRITSTSGGDAIQLPSGNVVISRTVCYQSGAKGSSSGINITAGNTEIVIKNCIISGFATGYVVNAIYDNCRIINCFGWNNTTDVSVSFNADTLYAFTSLSGDPFTNAAGGDFSLNNTTGAGALCRAGGVPAASGIYTMPGGVTLSYPDVGVAQHSDPVSGGRPFGPILAFAGEFYE